MSASPVRKSDKSHSPTVQEAVHCWTAECSHVALLLLCHVSLELFQMINELPTCYEVVSGKARSDISSQAKVAGGQQKRQRPAVSTALLAEPVSCKHCPAYEAECMHCWPFAQVQLPHRQHDHQNALDTQAQLSYSRSTSMLCLECHHMLRGLLQSCSMLSNYEA